MFCVKIADVPIQIDNRFDDVYIMCRDYLTNDEPMVSISVNDDEIEFERRFSDFDYSVGMFEATAVYRKISLKLLQFDAFLFHSAVIEFDGRAYAFAAKSGVGKSTHIRLWQECFGDRVKIINGDKPIMREINGQIYAYGTPWCGKEGYNINTKAPLGGVCFLERGESNHIEKMNAVSALGRIYSQIIMPKDKDKCDRMLSLLDDFVTNVPFYRLHCTISQDAVRVAHDMMVNG